MTVLDHPITRLPCVSIHPCKHADILKKLTETICAERGENAVGSHLAILIFLKFFADVIPSIPFDSSFDIIMDDGWLDKWISDFLKINFIF